MIMRNVQFCPYITNAKFTSHLDSVFFVSKVRSCKYAFSNVSLKCARYQVSQSYLKMSFLSHCSSQGCLHYFLKVGYCLLPPFHCHVLEHSVLTSFRRSLAQRTSPVLTLKSSKSQAHPSSVVHELSF